MLLFSHYEAAGSLVTVRACYWLMSWVIGSWKAQLPSKPEPLWRKGAGRHAQCDISGGADPSGNGYLEEHDRGGHLDAGPGVPGPGQDLERGRLGPAPDRPVRRSWCVAGLL